MRDRLIDILAKSGASFEYATPEDVADHLLAEGVLVPKAKIGDTIYVIPSKVNYNLNILHKMSRNNRVYEQVVKYISIYPSDYMLHTCDGLYSVIGKGYKDTWFLTKEEAERALERSENDI